MSRGLTPHGPSDPSPCAAGRRGHPQRRVVEPLDVLRHDLGDRVFRLIDPSRWDPALSRPPPHAGTYPCQPKVIPLLETDDSLGAWMQALELGRRDIQLASFDFSIGGVVGVGLPDGPALLEAIGHHTDQPASGLGMQAVATVWHPGPEKGGVADYPVAERIEASPVPVPPAAPVFALGLGAFKLSRRRPQRQAPTGLRHPPRGLPCGLPRKGSRRDG